MQASPSFKWLDMRTSMSTTYILITETPLPCYLTTDVLNDCYSEDSAYTVLAYPYWAGLHNAYGCLGQVH